MRYGKHQVVADIGSRTSKHQRDEATEQKAATQAECGLTRSQEGCARDTAESKRTDWARTRFKCILSSRQSNEDGDRVGARTEEEDPEAAQPEHAENERHFGPVYFNVFQTLCSLSSSGSANVRRPRRQTHERPAILAGRPRTLRPFSRRCAGTR